MLGIVSGTVTNPTHNAWIDLVLARAGELRRAGVLAIGGDGYTVQLAPFEAPGDGKIDKPDATADDYTLHPLNDPHSYPGGYVPGFQIERVELED